MQKENVDLDNGTGRHVSVKICGIRTRHDALLAADLGATYVGFVFVRKSPRYIDPAEAAEIVPALPRGVVPVGVFANQPRDRVLDIISVTGVKVAQFSGLESPEYCDSMGKFGVFKAFHVRPPFSFENLEPYHVNMFVLDTYVPGKNGGTGETFDWSLAIPVARKTRVMLAGGLTPANVVEAVETVRPYAVDVSSGVESSPGEKSPHLMETFFQSLHDAGYQTSR
ncbi:MAG TPA: phosphoribosylanthranilate isomerase [Candidatus Latescibacteria bacterium]|nr:phosphoribosylanthranilate isomerase [Candidatus Latescibacterota bacterium]